MSLIPLYTIVPTATSKRSWLECACEFSRKPMTLVTLNLIDDTIARIRHEQIQFDRQTQDHVEALSLLHGYAEQCRWQLRYAIRAPEPDLYISIVDNGDGGSKIIYDAPGYGNFRSIGKYKCYLIKE